MYLFARRFPRELGYESQPPDLLGASCLRLTVLAPTAYYRRAQADMLQSLRDSLNAGLAAECVREGPTGLRMAMDFEAFPNSFNWPCTDDQLIEALCSRSPVVDG